MRRSVMLFRDVSYTAAHRCILYCSSDVYTPHYESDVHLSHCSSDIQVPHGSFNIMHDLYCSLYVSYTTHMHVSDICLPQCSPRMNRGATHIIQHTPAQQAPHLIPPELARIWLVEPEMRGVFWHVVWGDFVCWAPRSLTR